MEQIQKGTKIKVNVSLELAEGMTMDDVAFNCTFYTYTDTKQVVAKEDMRRVDENNYIAAIDTSQLGDGEIKMRAQVDFHDEDFVGNTRTEFITIGTGIKVCK